MWRPMWKDLIEPLLKSINLKYNQLLLVCQDLLSNDSCWNIKKYGLCNRGVGKLNCKRTCNRCNEKPIIKGTTVISCSKDWMLRNYALIKEFSTRLYS